MPARKPQPRNEEIQSGLVALFDQGGILKDRDAALAEARAAGMDLIAFDVAASPPRCKFEAPAATRAGGLPPSTAPLDVFQAPTPLALAVREFDCETQPFRKVHRLIDAIEVFTKLHTVVVLSDLFQRAGASDRARGLLAEGLRTPSLGIWWMFAREFGRILQETGDGATVLSGVDRFVSDAGGLRGEMDGDANFIAFRNGYAHGATPRDEQCLADLAVYEPRFRRVLACAVHLRAAEWVHVDAAGRCWKFEGEAPVPMAPPCPGLQPGRCYVVRGSATLSLHPLLVCLPPEPGRFFFYNDLRNQHARFLNYEHAEHRTEAALRRELLEAYPIDDWAGSAPADFRQRIEELTETFKGRLDDLRRLLDFAEGEAGGFLMVWGGPGLGKSALLARFVQVLNWGTDLRSAEKWCRPSEGATALRVHPVAYFIRRGERNTDNADTLLTSLNLRLEQWRRTGIPPGEATAEKAARLHERLEAINKGLGENERLLLLVDGLDEGADAPDLLDCLPKSLPPRVLVLYASRHQPQVRNRVFLALDRERRQELALTGLTAEDARAILAEHVSKYDLHPDYLQEVARRSQGNPLYLKLLAQGLARGDYRLNDSTALPGTMQDIYAAVLARLEGTPGSISLLRLVAVARDHVTADMANALLALPAADDTAGTRLFPAIEELLRRRSDSELRPAYQMFHESVRDYLRERYPQDCATLEQNLYRWCLGWRARASAEERTYALRHLAGHARALLEQPPAGFNPGREREQIGVLAEDPDYQEASFTELGSGVAYQELCAVLLEQAARGDASGRSARAVRAAWNHHVQPARRREAMLRSLDGGLLDEKSILAIAESAPGPGPRVLLGLRGLAGRSVTVDPASPLATQLRSWAEEAGNGALTRLLAAHCPPNS